MKSKNWYTWNQILNVKCQALPQRYCNCTLLRGGGFRKITPKGLHSISWGWASRQTKHEANALRLSILPRLKGGGELRDEVWGWWIKGQAEWISLTPLTRNGVWTFSPRLEGLRLNGRFIPKGLKSIPWGWASRQTEPWSPCLETLNIAQGRREKVS